MEQNTPLLELIAVSKFFESPAGGHTPPVLSSINLVVKQGETLAIIGPSGSGKSTLLNLIGGLDQPSSGQVCLAGKQISSLNQNELARIRNQEIGFIFQQHHLLAQLTVLENVMVPCLAVKKSSDNKASEERARMLLDRAGLKERISYWPGQLSGGERQRVAVVRALINEPKLLLADEPTGSLDRNTSCEMADLLLSLNQQDGVTLITVTHSMELACRMQRVMELRDGSLSPWEKSKG